MRHKSPSIIYAQIGTGSGGIILNLGTEGMSCHLAQKLSASIHSTFPVRLRGSGLHAELTGEVMWLGPTRKEVGWRFVNPPAGVQQNIADWIERQSRPPQEEAAEPRSQSKPAAAFPARPVGPVGPVIDGLRAEQQSVGPAAPSGASAPIPISVAKPAEAAAASKVEGSVGAAAPAPRPELVPPASHPQPYQLDRKTIIDKLSGRAYAQEHHAYATNSPAAQSAAPATASSDATAADRPRQSSMGAAIGSANAAPNQLPVVPAAAKKLEVRTAADIVPVLEARLGPLVDRLLDPRNVEQWVPPALLVAWRRGTRRRKALLAGGAAACMVLFLSMFVLAVTHADRTAAPSDGATPQISSDTPAPAKRVISSRPRGKTPRSAFLPPPPPQSIFDTFVDNVTGRTHPLPIIEIDDDEVPVRVWTSQKTGYYFCTDNDFYKNVQPGSFMSQGEALQNGYRPKVGQFCE